MRNLHFASLKREHFFGRFLPHYKRLTCAGWVILDAHSLIPRGFRGLRLRVGRFWHGRARALLAAENRFLRQDENRLAVLGNDFPPPELAQHGEIDASETQPREKYVGSITERLVIAPSDCRP